jgi:hypothetical protein
MAGWSTGNRLWGGTDGLSGGTENGLWSGVTGISGGGGGSGVHNILTNDANSSDLTNDSGSLLLTPS